MGLFRKPADPPSKDDFAKAVLKAIQARSPQTRLRYVADEFRLQDDNGERQTNLGNVYEEHCRLKPDERAGHIKMLASVFCEAGNEVEEDYEDARTHLRPKIWTRSTFEDMELQQRIKGSERSLDLPLYPVGSHLYSSLVYDLPTAMRSVSNDDLENWGVTIYQALEDAVLNLENEAMSVGKVGDGFYTLMTGDNYDSARLMLTDRLRSLEVNGDHIAIVPQRDALFLAGSDDVQSLEILLELTRQTLENQTRPLSPLPLRLGQDGWEDWMPDDDHPLYRKFAELRHQFLGELYATQKQLLEKLYEQEGNEVFVASYSAIQKKDSDEVLSYCVWGEGVDALLPMADLVMLPTQESLAAVGLWKRVRRAAGALMQPVPDMYPPRFRVREFPSQFQLREIGVLDLG